MTGRQALEQLRQMENEGTIDDVLNVDMVSTGDVKQYADALYDGYSAKETAVLDGILDDRKAVDGIVEQALDDVFPYGDDFISAVQGLLNEKVKEGVKE